MSFGKGHTGHTKSSRRVQFGKGKRRIKKSKNLKEENALKENKKARAIDLVTTNKSPPINSENVNHIYKID